VFKGVIAAQHRHLRFEQPWRFSVRHCLLMLITVLKYFLDKVGLETRQSSELINLRAAFFRPP